jgi:hypothetical protein
MSPLPSKAEVEIDGQDFHAASAFGSKFKELTVSSPVLMKK